MTVTRLWLIVCAIMAIMIAYWYVVANHRQQKILSQDTQIAELKAKVKNLNNEKEACNDKVAKFNEAQENAANKIEKIRTVVKTVKADCDCYNSRLPDDVVRLLHGK